ncbi:MAG: S-layer homology domain-containing protein [Candidatus Margulisiibacteriota bacterium]
MKRFAVLLLLMMAASADAQFLPGSARPLGLGNAFVGQADDASAVIYNPAGTAALEDLGWITLYNSQPESSQNYISLGVVVPSKSYGTIGVSYQNLGQTGVLVLPATVEVDTYSRQIGLVYARPVFAGILLGGEVRFLAAGTSGNFPGVEKYKSSGYAIDLSLKKSLTPWFSAGLVLRNVSAQVKYDDGLAADLPAESIFGASFLLLGNKGLVKNKVLQGNLNFDLSKKGSGQSLNHVGFEITALRTIAFRFGNDQVAVDDQSTGNQQIYSNFTLGIGLKYRGISFDYAQYKQGNVSASITHYFSIGFGGLDEKDEPAKLPTVITVAFPTPESLSAQKIKLPSFKDVPKGHWAYRAAGLVVAAGLMRAYPDGTFQPDGWVSRGTFEQLLAEAKHLPAVPIFEANKPITRGEVATKLEIFKPDRPNAPVKRGEIAIFLTKSTFGQAAINRLPPIDETN